MVFIWIGTLNPLGSGVWDDRDVLASVERRRSGRRRPRRLLGAADDSRQDVAALIRPSRAPNHEAIVPLRDGLVGAFQAGEDVQVTGVVAQRWQRLGRRDQLCDVALIIHAVRAFRARPNALRGSPRRPMRADQVGGAYNQRLEPKKGEKGV